MRLRPLSLFVVLLLPVCAANPDGAALYAAHCARCHEPGAPRVPDRQALHAMSGESIVRALTSGTMRFQGSYLSHGERAAVASFLTGKPIEPRPALAGRCAAEASKTFDGPQWNGWGADVENSRMQTTKAAGLSPQQIPQLSLKWAFAFPGDFVAFAQPIVAGGRVFTGSAGGFVYSLDAQTGCVYWAFDAGAGVRTAITIGPRNAAYFGDLQANVYAVDAVTGKQLWKTRVDDHPVARITGSPVLFEERLYVPVSSHEEWTSADPAYECCKFRGSVVALDAKTGKRLWKTYTIADPPHPLRKNPRGVQMWGPSGGAVWSAPTIDKKLKMLYVGTGDGYSGPLVNTTDSIMALRLDNGKIVWSSQITEADIFNTNCLMPDRSNCPDEPGPDFDFGASPILTTLADGRRVLVAVQKSGSVHALDPDSKGEALWHRKVGKGGILGGFQWGAAVDQGVVYMALSDLSLQPDLGFQPNPKVGGGLFAIQIASGDTLWETPSLKGKCAAPGCSPAQSAAVTVIPGVVFSGALDGHLRAYSTADGTILWDYDTAKEYDAVNKAPAHGGSLDGPGPAIAGGMLFVNSGYGYFNGMPGNVLLAFGLK